MSESTSVEKKQKSSWFKGLAAEFKKIIWPDKQTIVRQTVTVVVISVALGIIILAVDGITLSIFEKIFPFK